jgi:hypothetical protein
LASDALLDGLVVQEVRAFAVTLEDDHAALAVVRGFELARQDDGHRFDWGPVIVLLVTPADAVLADDQHRVRPAFGTGRHDDVVQQHTVHAQRVRVHVEDGCRLYTGHLQTMLQGDQLLHPANRHFIYPPTPPEGVVGSQRGRIGSNIRECCRETPTLLIGNGFFSGV